MSPGQLSLQLTEAKETFIPIIGNTSYEDIVHICDTITPLLLQVGYNKAHAKHNLWGIIAPAGACVENYGEPFAPPKNIGAYPPILQEAID